MESRRRRRIDPDSGESKPEQSALLPEEPKSSPPEPAKPKRASPWAGEAFYKNYEKVVGSIVDSDIDGTFEELERRLRIGSGAGKQISGGELMEAIDRVQSDYVQASRLANKARREYELYKVAHESWLEEKKAAALVGLEDLKAQKKLTKQITESMLNEAVMSTWPDDYAGRLDKLKSFQAAVHQIEALSTAYGARARSLSDLKELVLAFK